MSAGKRWVQVVLGPNHRAVTAHISQMHQRRQGDNIVSSASAVVTASVVAPLDLMAPMT